MEAASEAEVVARLQRQGSMPMRAEPAGGGRAGALLHVELAAAAACAKQEVADFIRELATMLARRAGPGPRACAYMQETAPNARVRRVVTRLRDAVRDGSPLSVGAGGAPGQLPAPAISAWCAPGEAGGKLAATLDRHGAICWTAQRSLAASVSSALIYPACCWSSRSGRSRCC